MLAGIDLQDRVVVVTGATGGLGEETACALASVGARVILCTPTVIGEKIDGTNEYDGMLEEYSAISRKVATDTDCQMLDLRQIFMGYLKANNPENLKRGVLTRDGVHLNKKGNSFLSGLVLDALHVPLVD